MWNTCLIGRGWKSREGWSRPVLTGDGDITFQPSFGGWFRVFLVAGSFRRQFGIGMVASRLSMGFVVRVRCPVPGPPRSRSLSFAGRAGVFAGMVASWLVAVLCVVGFAVVMAQVRRPVPFRTRKLRPGTVMVLHSRGCGRVARRRICLVGLLLVCVLVDRPEGVHFLFWPGLAWLVSGRIGQKGRPGSAGGTGRRLRASWFIRFIGVAGYTGMPCITSYRNVAPSRIRSCITTRQRLSRPPTRVGVNVVLSCGCIGAISAEPGILRIAIRNPATHSSPSTNRSNPTPARRAINRAGNNADEGSARLRHARLYEKGCELRGKRDCTIRQRAMCGTAESAERLSAEQVVNPGLHV